MSHYSPVPPEERVYAKNYRKELQPFEAQIVEVSGRVKEIRDHPERSDLQSILLVNLTIHPLARGKPKRIIKLPHLWVLAKHIVRLGLEPKKGRRILFQGSVYAYFRLGGKSKQRGLHGFHDFSILPMGPPEIESFTPGIKQRYEVKEDDSNRSGDLKGEKRSGKLVSPKVKRSKNSHRRHGDHRNS